MSVKNDCLIIDLGLNQEGNDECVVSAHSGYPFVSDRYTGLSLGEALKMISDDSWSFAEMNTSLIRAHSLNRRYTRTMVFNRDFK